MNTPTPRTDEAWSSAFNAEDFSASSVARSMRVFSQKIEIELATERARFDWLESDAGLDWQWSDPAGGLVSRAKVDAAMKEGTK